MGHYKVFIDIFKSVFNKSKKNKKHHSSESSIKSSRLSNNEDHN